MIIVDASVPVLWFIRQKQSPAALAFLNANPGFVAPSFIILEVAAALLRAVRRGALGEGEYRAAIGEGLPKHVEYWDDLPPLATDAARIAAFHGGSVYDACYIALAQQLNAPLVTADKGQADIGRKTGIGIEWIE